MKNYNCYHGNIETGTLRNWYFLAYSNFIRNLKWKEEPFYFNKGTSFLGESHKINVFIQPIAFIFYSFAIASIFLITYTHYVTGIFSLPQGMFKVSYFNALLSIMCFIHFHELFMNQTTSYPEPVNHRQWNLMKIWFETFQVALV